MDEIDYPGADNRKGKKERKKMRLFMPTLPYVPTPVNHASIGRILRAYLGRVGMYKVPR